MQNRVLNGLFLLSFLVFFISGCDKYTRHEELAFFFIDIPSHEGETIPEASYFLHGPYAARQCYQCHVKSPIRLHTSILGPPADRQCYQCHVKSPTFSFRETGKKETGGIPKLQGQSPGSLVSPLKDLCLECHPPKPVRAAHWSNEGPVSDGNCTFCHDPHHSPFRYMLRKKI